MEPNLYDEIRFIRETLSDNHNEVCQRITELETTVKLTAPLSDRVRALEDWRNYIVGAVSIIGLVGTAAVTWLKAHIR